uniref:Kinesin motor domain-containing protein n=1 Tax=Percolomonas cosmopolitus TaxID=63605 RepID=A0A7S1KTU7_9EUKA
MSKIKVYARIRSPLGNPNPLECAFVDENTALVAVKTDNSVSKHEIDQIFDHESTQDQIFEEIGKKAINSMLKGFSVTLMAYGATGSGKTHSLWGESIKDPKCWGLIPRIVQGILDRFQDSERFTKTQINVTYLQDYKSNLEDLLNDKKSVAMRNNQPYGASSRKVNSTSDLIEVLEKGSKNRAVASHAMNDKSSRSHAIFIIEASFFDVQDEATMSGSIYLYDLAGIERAGQMNVADELMDEAKYINSSLSMLSQVLTALAHNAKVQRTKKGKERFVGFRNTMLTQCLKAGLSGETVTSILLTLSASSKMQQDLLARSVMEFGETARQLRVKPKKNKKKVSKKKMNKNARKLQSESSAFKKEQDKQALEAKEKLKKRMALMGVKNKEEEEKERRAKELAQKKQALLATLHAFESYAPLVENDELMNHAIGDRDENAKAVKNSVTSLINAQKEWIAQVNSDDLTAEQVESLMEEAKKRLETVQAEVNPQLDKLQELIDEERQAVEQAKQTLAVSVRNKMRALQQVQIFDANKKDALDQVLNDAIQLCTEFGNEHSGETAADFEDKRKEFLEKVQPSLDQLQAQMQSEKQNTEDEINKLKSYLNNIRGAMSDIGDSEDKKASKDELQSVYDNGKALLEKKMAEDDAASLQDALHYSQLYNNVEQKVNPIFAQMDQTDLERKKARNSIHSLLEQTKDKLQARYAPEGSDEEMSKLIDDMNRLLDEESSWIDNRPNESIEDYNNKAASLKEQFHDLFGQLNAKKAEKVERAAKARENLQVYIDSKKQRLHQFAPREIAAQDEKDRALNFVQGYSSWLDENPKEIADVYHAKQTELADAVEPIVSFLKKNNKKEKEAREKALQNVNNYLASVQKIFDEKGDRLDDSQKDQVKDALAAITEWLANSDDKSPDDLKEKLQQMQQMLDNLVEKMLTEEVPPESEEDDVEHITRDSSDDTAENDSEKEGVYKDKEMLSDIFSTEIAELKRKFEGLPATLPEITRLCVIFPPNKKYFLDLGGLDKIVPYMDRSNEHHGHCVVAASAISQIADFPEARERARELGACSLLRNVLTLVAATQSHSQVAARATEQLAEECEENALLLQEHLLDPFIEQFKETQNQNTLQYICSAMNKLAEYNNKVQEKLIALGAMDKVSKLTFYDSQSMREASLDMITALSQSSPEFRRAFTEANGFDTIKNAFIWAREKKDEAGNVVRAEDTTILRKCGGALFYLIQDESFRALYDEWQYNKLLRGHILHYLASIGNFSVGSKEPEMVTSNDEGDPFVYTGTSYYGEMKGQRLGGGPQHLTFRENWQYMVTVEHEEESSICFCISDKSEESTLRKNHPVYVGFHLVHNQESLDDYHQIDIAESVYKDRHGAAFGENYWIIRDLPKGTYRLIVYSTRKDQLTDYALSMYSSHPDVSLDPIVNDVWLRQIFDTHLRRSSTDSTVGGTEKSLYWRNDPQFVVTAESDIQITIAAGYASLEEQPGQIPMVLRLLSPENETSPMRVMDLSGSSRARSYTHTQVTIDLKAGESQHVQIGLDTQGTDIEARLRLITYAMGAYKVEPVSEWSMVRFDNDEDWPERVEFEIERDNVPAAATSDEAGEMELVISLEWEDTSDESPPEVSFDVEDSQSIQEIPLGYLKDTDRTMNMTHVLTEKKHKFTMIRASEHAGTKFHLRICGRDPISVNILTPTIVEISEEKLINQSNLAAFEKYSPKERTQDDLMETLLTDQAKSAVAFEFTAEEQLLSNRINSLQKELHDALMENAQVESLKRKMDDQNAQIKRLKNDVENLNKQLEEAKSNLLVAQSAQNDEKLTDEEKQKLIDNINSLKKDLSKANANANMMQAKTQKEINEMREKVARADELEMKVKELEEQLASAKESVQKADQSSNDDLEKQLKTLQQQLEKEQEKVKKQESSDEKLRKELTEAQTQIADLQKRLKEAQESASSSKLQKPEVSVATPPDDAFSKTDLEKQGIVFSPRGKHIVGTKETEEKLTRLTEESRKHQEEAQKFKSMVEAGDTPHSVHTIKSDGGNTDNRKSSTCVIS